MTLPPKRFIKDNYEKRFLDGRRLGLQTFLENLTLNKDIVSRCVSPRQERPPAVYEFDPHFLPSEALKNFLSMVGRLSPFDSLEDSRVRLPSQGFKALIILSGELINVDYRRFVRLWRRIIIIFE